MKKSKLYGSRLIEDNKLTITPELVTLESTDDVTNLTFDRGNILDAASIKLYLAATSDDLTTKYNTLNENVTTNSNDIITINTLLTTTAESINSINANITTINNSLVDYGIALEYVDNKLILKNKNSDTLSSIDLSAMTENTYLDTVTFSNNKLIFTWNEGSSKKPITIDLSRLKDKDGNELSVGNILAKSKLLFLSKNDSDTAKGLITFMKGVRIGNYTSESGGIIDVDLITGLTYLEVDKLKVRMKAYFETLSIINELSIAGKWTISPGGSILCTRVNITAELNYKCYFTNILDNVQIENKFAVNDLAISKDFNIKTVEYQSATNHYYWRKVLEVGEDYIVLSKTDCDTGSDAPNVGDVICQLGNTTDADRLNALIFSSVDETSPCVNLYSGINTYSLANKEYVSYGVNKTTNKAFMNVYGDMYFGDRPTVDNLYEGASYVKFNSTDKKVTIKGELDVKSTVGGTKIDLYIKNNSLSEIDVNSLINNSTVISDMQNLIDGAIETYFYTGVPTLSNLPASGWVEVATETNKEIYANHVGDLYYDKDTGKAYRFMKDGNTGIYSWITITDIDITKALADSSEALLTANVKKRIFYGTPTPPYDKGDLWVEATYPVGTTKTDAVNNEYYSEILYCNTAKALGSLFAITDWRLSNNYTKSIGTVITDLDGYKYIKDALLNDTETSGGLILSSLIALRDSSNNILSGINGTLNPEAIGKGIATWWGGKMIDGGFAPSHITTTVADYATSLIRFDGSGYLANGTISWDTNGKIHADPTSFFVGPTNISIITSLFSTIPTDATSYSLVTKIHPTKPFDTLTAETINITNLAFSNGTVSSIADPASYKNTDNNSIATPNFVSFFGNKTYLSKLNNDAAKGIIDFQKGIKLNSHSVTDIIKSGDDIQDTDTLIMSVAKQLATFMRKDVEDSTDFIQTFTKGIKALLVQSDDYSTGMLGAGFTLKNDANGDSYVEVDRGLFRKTVTFYELLIQKIKSVGGQILLSPTQMNCIKVEEQADSYRCYFKNNEDGKVIYNEFEVNDLARRQDFNVKTGSKYYWRKVIAIGDNYIDLSKTDCDADSGVPEVGDDIILIGNSSDIARQGAIVLSAYGPDSPYIKIYQGINSYSLSGKERATLSPSKIDITADSFKFSTGKSVKEYIDNNIIVPCGNWQLGTSYLKNRLVTFNNQTFISTVDTSDCPIVVLANENGDYLVDENDNYITPTDENGNVTYNPSWKAYSSSEVLEQDVAKFKKETTTTFEILNDEINSKVSSATYDMLGRRVGTAESTITQHAKDIASKVAQTDYNGNSIASLINQTATTIQIQASRINLVGAVTFSAFNSDLQTSFNDKASISSVTDAQDTADAAITRNNTMAVKLGYTDYNALSSAAALGHTLIDGGMISTVLINAKAVVTNGLTANCITANMISSGSVTADQIDANSVSTAIAKVISLDAGRITTGTLSADRIDAVSVVTKGLVAQTIDAQSATISNLNVVNATVSGTLNGVSGTFNYLQAVGSSGRLIFNNTYGSLAIEDEDFRQQGSKNHRSLRFYSENIRCRGSFGAVSLNMARVHDYYIDYYVNGDTDSYVRFNLQSNGIGGYYVPLYPSSSTGYNSSYGNATLNDIYGFPVDLLIFDNTGFYKYEILPGAVGKEVTVINAHDGQDQFNIGLYKNGIVDVGLRPGKAQLWVNLIGLIDPAVSTDKPGRGWLVVSDYDNNWA